METISKPQPKTSRSPNTSISFPETSPETNLTMAKLETINPTSVFETPKVRAKIGIAGMINPKPIATRKEIVDSTETSRGRPAKGDLKVRIFIRSPRQLHLVEPQRAHCYLEVASHEGRWQRRSQVRQQGRQPERLCGMLT